MAVLTVIKGKEQQMISCPEGTLLSEALRMEHLPLEMPCGGKGTCGKCRVRATGKLSAPSSQEAALLSQQESQRDVRFACMTRIEGDALVRLFEPGENVVMLEREENGFPRKAPSRGLGVAVDVGTTTVAAYLYRLSDGCMLGQAGAANPQSAWGADVISRIGRALEGEGEVLAQRIRCCLDDLIRTLTEQTHVSAGEITHMVITANTAMLYLLTGSNPESLSHAPFAADRLFGECRSGEELGLSCAPQAQVYLPRCISAFVGADITTAILASGMGASTGPALLLDIGTNGEMALWKDGTIRCCSTAAGPALEGGNLYKGMPALPGAIDSVQLKNGRISYTTIGNVPARGLCGSGVIDAVAVLLRAGIVEDTGAISEEGHLFLSQLCEVDGRPAFCFEKSEVVLTQQDIRNVQLAKGAICAGILTLLEQAGLTPEDMDTLYLAGGFGSYLSIESATAIGLIPQAFRRRTKVIGNAAGAGACMLLQNTDFWRQTEKLANRAETVELSQNPSFNNHYMDCMLFDRLQGIDS